MNNIRTSYVKVLPLVLLIALLGTGLEIYGDYHFKMPSNRGEINPLGLLITVIKIGLAWGVVGWVFKKIKQAAIAFGTAAVLYVINYFLFRTAFIQQSIVLNNLQTFLFNYNFLPALVFGWLCFGTRGLLYFLPMALYSYALMLLHLGGMYLDTSPYNAWYRYLRIDDHFKVYIGDHRYWMMNMLSYTYHLVAPCITFILIGECFHAATHHKRFKESFHVDFSTRYTKGGALGLFYSLRFAISLLVVGLYKFPVSSLTQRGRFYYGGVSLYTVIVTLLAGIGCLIFVVMYYRKFLVEYFIGIRRKIFWLFWIVNTPLIGLFVFPFVVFINRFTGTTEERTRFFYNDAWYLKPYKILVAMLVLSFLGTLFAPPMQEGATSFWVLWFVELALLIWYTVAVSGFYAMLILGTTGFLFFLISVFEMTHKYNEPQPFFNGNSNASLAQYTFSTAVWMVSTFNLVQYAILLPVFHLERMRTVQPMEQEG